MSEKGMFEKAGSVIVPAGIAVDRVTGQQVLLVAVKGPTDEITMSIAQFLCDELGVRMARTMPMIEKVQKMADELRAQFDAERKASDNAALDAKFDVEPDAQAQAEAAAAFAAMMNPGSGKVN